MFPSSSLLMTLWWCSEPVAKSTPCERFLITWITIEAFFCTTIKTFFLPIIIVNLNLTYFSSQNTEFTTHNCDFIILQFQGKCLNCEIKKSQLHFLYSMPGISFHWFLLKNFLRKFTKLQKMWVHFKNRYQCRFMLSMHHMFAKDLSVIDHYPK